MSFTFDQTVGGVNATNTASVEFADAYFETRAFAAAWTEGLDGQTPKKQALLVAAANRLQDDESSLSGTRASLSQRLCQPRFGAYADCEIGQYYGDVQRGVAIATHWKEAECEMALFLAELKASPTSVDKLAPFSQVKMPSGLELTMREKNPRTNDGLPVAVRRKLRYLRVNVGDTVERA